MAVFKTQRPIQLHLNTRENRTETDRSPYWIIKLLHSSSCAFLFFRYRLFTTSTSSNCCCFSLKTFQRSWTLPLAAGLHSNYSPFAAPYQHLNGQRKGIVCMLQGAACAAFLFHIHCNSSETTNTHNKHGKSYN